ncbi:TetR/AcrR family transcriptional regulator [Actinospica sp.]|jgi:AcrR family transcriptional regulator|uniref:TetR/AcrR family transcriptional regulator n=1 Tax=Actinospica sp. TaxID=1872142 RepID=UPI002B7B9CEB|nr:TetR/AcrR family transcriptional regulator [Actinospica sp.]HWG27595.1 TetR/AcrR family transcriptional regulator [Actinospica sp.]
MDKRTYRSPRRDQNAAQTRDAILDAAEELFATSGYAQTTVGNVANAAQVATNTVYTSVGGKPQLVLALTERGMADPAIAQSLDGIDAADSAAEVLRLLAWGTGQTTLRHLRVITVLYDNALADPLIADMAQHANLRYRQNLDRAARRLGELHALRPDVDQAQASDVLWFYFGWVAWRQLHEMGWAPERAEQWLLTQATAALLESADRREA